MVGAAAVLAATFRAPITGSQSPPRPGPARPGPARPANADAPGPDAGRPLVQRAKWQGVQHLVLVCRTFCNRTMLRYTAGETVVGSPKQRVSKLCLRVVNFWR